MEGKISYWRMNDRGAKVAKKTGRALAVACLIRVFLRFYVIDQNKLETRPRRNEVLPKITLIRALY